MTYFMKYIKLFENFEGDLKMANMEFVPGASGKDCAEKAGGWGLKSTVLS